MAPEKGPQPGRDNGPGNRGSSAESGRERTRLGWGLRDFEGDVYCEDSEMGKVGWVWWSEWNKSGKRGSAPLH